MKTFLSILILCCLTTAVLMSLEEQVVAGAGCDEEVESASRPGYVPNNQYPLHLSLNYNKGTYLVFSDDRTYEIAPDDRIYAAYWVTPFPPEFGLSDDPLYPILITNPYSDRSVRAREVSTREVLKEEMTPTPSSPNELELQPITPETTPQNQNKK